MSFEFNFLFWQWLVWIR